MIWLYNKKDSIFLVFFVLFMDYWFVRLFIFFTYEWIILSYDPGVFLLYLIIHVPGIWMNFFFFKQFQLIDRYFTRCKLDENGIHIFLFGKKRRVLLWSEICTYGITGSHMKAILFFSKDPTEVYSKKLHGLLNDRRIIFEVRKRILDTVFEHMPIEMKKNLEYSIKEKRDCFHRRKTAL